MMYTLRNRLEEEITIALRSAGLETKRRILQTCVKLFLEKGYKKTTMGDILSQCGVSSSSFQNIFHAKDGVLVELVEFMFSNQFGTARSMAKNLPPVCVYAVETAIQLTLTELNENLREIYVEAYSHQAALDYIVSETAKEIQAIFGPYNPGLEYQDFHDMDIGSSGLMRSYMQAHCDGETLTLERKISYFLHMTLRCYNVPQEEANRAIALVAGMDVRAVANQVMHHLFQALMMRYEFTLSE